MKCFPGLGAAALGAEHDAGAGEAGNGRPDRRQAEAAVTQQLLAPEEAHHGLLAGDVCPALDVLSCDHVAAAG